jgi:hypothetical protein
LEEKIMSNEAILRLEDINSVNVVNNEEVVLEMSGRVFNMRGFINKFKKPQFCMGGCREAFKKGWSFSSQGVVHKDGRILYF